MRKNLIFAIIFFFLYTITPTSFANISKIKKSTTHLTRRRISKFEINYLPGQIRFYKNNYIFLSYYSENKVFLYDFNGEKIREFGGKGEGPGEVRELGTFCTSRDKIYINDWNGEIEVFDINTTKNLKTIKYGKFGDDINVSANGDIYLIFGEFNRRTLSRKEYVAKLFEKKNKYQIKKITPGYENEFIKAVISGGKRRVIFVPFYRQMVYRILNDKIYWGYPDHFKIFKYDNYETSMIINDEDSKIKYNKKMLEILKERYLSDSIRKRLNRVKIVPHEYLPEFSTFFLSKEIGFLIVTLYEINDQKNVEIRNYSIDGKYICKFSIPKFYMCEISRNTSATLSKDMFAYITESEGGSIHVIIEKLKMTK